jgi:hypothetical protein
VFLAYYFASFGLGDLVGLFSLHPPAPTFGGASSSLYGSIAILLGAICFLLGYAVATGLPAYRASGWSAREWAPRPAAFVGVAWWAIGWIATASLQFGAADPYSGQHINPTIGGFLALIRVLQPIGSLLLIYLYLTTRGRKILALLLVTMALDFALGFFGGSKQIALRAPVLFMLSVVLTRERIPVVTLIVFTLVTAVFFNAFQSYRNELASRGLTRGAALAQFNTPENTLGTAGTPWGERLSGGFDYFVMRVSQKPMIDMIVGRTGKGGIRFQDGATLVPLLYAFIPRLVWPGKPNNVTGLLFNHTFHVATASTFIGSSNLGDLYWNFGWAGVVVGMLIIGIFMGWAASMFRLDSRLTLPKFLLLLITIYFGILRFQSGIALVYTLWARAALLLLLIHVMMPKVRGRIRVRRAESCSGVYDAGDGASGGEAGSELEGRIR